MIRILFLFIFICLAAAAKATDLCEAELASGLEPLIAHEARLGVDIPHRSRAYLHIEQGRVVKTRLSVVVMHGLLNSPEGMDWIAQKAFALGFNVLNIRLPSHFEAHREATDLFKAKEAIELSDQMSRLAQGLGHKVVYIGHSTGAAVSLISAMNHHDLTAGLILFSPALQVSSQIRFLSTALSSLGLSGWLTDKMKPWFQDPQNRYRSTYAGVEVARMADEMAATPGEEPDYKRPYGALIERLNDMPMIWVDTGSDKIVDIEINESVARQLPSTTYIRLPEILRIPHNSTFFPAGTDKSETTRALQKVTRLWGLFLNQIN